MGIRAEFTPGIICDGIAGVGSAGSSFRLYHSSNFSERVALLPSIENHVQSDQRTRASFPGAIWIPGGAVATLLIRHQHAFESLIHTAAHKVMIFRHSAVSSCSVISGESTYSGGRLNPQHKSGEIPRFYLPWKCTAASMAISCFVPSQVPGW
jgi:hypothetical protein